MKKTQKFFEHMEFIYSKGKLFFKKFYFVVFVERECPFLINMGTEKYMIWQGQEQSKKSKKR